MTKFWGKPVAFFLMVLVTATAPHAALADEMAVSAPAWKSDYSEGWDVALKIKAKLVLDDNGSIKDCEIVEPVMLPADNVYCEEIELTEEAIGNYKELPQKPDSVATHLIFQERAIPRAPAAVAAEAIKAGDWRLANNMPESFATIPYGWLCLKPVFTAHARKLMGVPEYLQKSKPWDERDFLISSEATLAFIHEYNRLLLDHPNSPYRGVCVAGKKFDDNVFTTLKAKFDTTIWPDDGSAAAAARAGNRKLLLERLSTDEWAVRREDKLLNMSAMEWAIVRGDVATAELILPFLNGANGKRAVTHWAEKALFAAMHFRRTDMVDWIIERGKPDFDRMIKIDSPSFGWLERSFGTNNAKKLVDHFVRSSTRPLEVIAFGIGVEQKHRVESAPMSLTSRYALGLPIVAASCPVIIQSASPDCRHLRSLLAMMESADDVEYFLATVKVDVSVIAENILQSVEHKQVARLNVLLQHKFDRQTVAAKLRNRWNLPRSFANSYNYVEGPLWHTYKPDPEREKKLASEREMAQQEREKLAAAENRRKEKQIYDLLLKAGFVTEELPIPSAS